MGSSAEYGNVKSPQKENAKCKPKSVYGQAKLLSSIYLIDLFKKQKFPSTILRLYNTYGSRQDWIVSSQLSYQGVQKIKNFRVL